MILPESNWLKGAISFRSLVVIVSSLVLLGLTLFKSGIQWSDLSFSGLQFWHWLLAVFFCLLGIYIQSLRVKVIWRVWLSESSKIHALEGLILCSFYNCILPGNLGELVRAWHFSRKNNVSFVRSFASQGVEKYIDAWWFIINSAFLVYLFNVPAKNYLSVLLPMGILLLVISVYLLFITHRHSEKLMGNFILVLKRPGKSMYKWYYHTKDILLNMPPSSFSLYIFYGLSMFFVNVAQFYFVLKASGLTAPMLSIQTACWIAMGMVIIFAIPSAPGNIGVMHYGIFAVLIFVAELHSIQQEQSVLKDFAKTAVYLHLSYFIPEIIAGFFVLWKEKRWL